jgi:DNA-directed RNA polymerase subunit RPC12/RpoP
MHCPDCNSKVMSFQEYCQKCSAELRKNKEKYKNVNQYIIVGKF